GGGGGGERLGAAERWSPDGGAEPRRTAGVSRQRALPELGGSVLSGRDRRLVDQAGRRRLRGADGGPELPPPHRAANPPGAAGRRGRLFRLVLLPVGARHGLGSLLPVPGARSAPPLP